MSDESVETVSLESPDLIAQNRAALAALFPGVVDDGVFDAEKLGELLELDVAAVHDSRERFGLQWSGKRDAVRSLLSPSKATLVPDVDDSIDFDPAGNVFIEGDNLEVLKLLQKAYNDRVKLIYIDPPYNTGNDFVYNDDFRDGLRGYLEYTGQLDEEGKRTSTDVDASGRRHSKWLSMMYPRLMLARNLLAQDGAIFVSIDDNEGANLRLLLDEVFGPENFLALVIWNHTKQSRNDERHFSRQHNSILVYRRSDALRSFTLERREEHNKAYSNPDNDPKGPWRSGDVRSPSPRPNLRYEINTPSGGTISPPDNGWRWSSESVAEKIASGEIIFSADETRIVRKIYLADQAGRTPENIWDTSDVGGTREATNEIKELFGAQVFDTPKPTRLIRRILELATSPNTDDVVLDFFAGSGSTAHAVVLQNAEDGGTRRSISINMPEQTREGSDADKAGFKTVSEITLARLKKVAKIVPGGAEAGLRVFRLGPSNFQDEAGGESLFDLSDTSLASDDPDWLSVAVQVFLNEGVSLDAEIHRSGDLMEADGVTVVATLNLDDQLVEEAVGSGSRVLVFMEDGFAGKDALKANAVANARNKGITLKTV